MKTYILFGILWSLTMSTAAGKINPCDKWTVDFIQVDPRVNDGTSIDKYVQSKLQDDTSLQGMINCMVGLRIYSNCNGEFSFENQPYLNDDRSAKECKILQQKIVTIMKGIKNLKPGRTARKDQDFIFKLVVRVKRNGKPSAEILYYSS